MKYVMLEDTEGRKIPIIFPDHLVHADVAMVMCKLINTRQKVRVGPTSAGFISVGVDIQTHGESETLGLKSKPTDTDYIIAGDAGALMPEFMIAGLVQRIKARAAPKG